MQIKDLPPFRQSSTMKNLPLMTEQISENSEDFLHCTAKSLNIKFLHPMRSSIRMLSFKMRSLKELKSGIFDQQS